MADIFLISEYRADNPQAGKKKKKKALRFFVKTRRFTGGGGGSKQNQKKKIESPSSLTSWTSSCAAQGCPSGSEGTRLIKKLPSRQRAARLRSHCPQVAARPRAGGRDPGGRPRSAGAHRPSAGAAGEGRRAPSDPRSPPLSLSSSAPAFYF